MITIAAIRNINPMAMSGELKIDLRAIQYNYKLLDDMSDITCETGVSIKANAYGLGVKEVAPALYKAGGRNFFVANLNEGIELRNILPQAIIYILNGFIYCDRFIYQKYNLIPVLNSLAEIKLYQDFAHKLEMKIPAIIHFDTAMNRLGLPFYETEILCDDMSLIEGINIKYVMSHFASSDEKCNPLNYKQYDIFSKIAAYFKNTKSSLCNSGGIFLSEKYHMDLTRPGIALYGGNPTAGAKNKMHHPVSLKAPVLQIKSAQKGEFAGYNATYRFNKTTNIAIISIGYADGFLRSLGNNASLYWHGYKMPIRGRVSMDLVICDLSQIPDQYSLKTGDMVEVIGTNQNIDDLAKAAGTISYEILTSLGNRYTRLYD